MAAGVTGGRAGLVLLAVYAHRLEHGLVETGPRLDVRGCGQRVIERAGDGVVRVTAVGAGRQMLHERFLVRFGYVTEGEIEERILGGMKLSHGAPPCP